MKVDVGARQSMYYFNYILMEVDYMEEDYQEFINVREFGFESCWAGIGGFVGIFLGYSCLRIPGTLGQLLVWISMRIQSLKERFYKGEIEY